MNKKGQSLVMFILLIPIILVLCAFIVDYGITVNRNIKQKNIIKYSMENNYEIISYTRLNKIHFETIKKFSENGKECAIISSKVKSVFGTIIGYNEYKVESKYCK